MHGVRAVIGILLLACAAGGKRYIDKSGRE